jgi:uncharacterized membrane protein
VTSITKLIGGVLLLAGALLILPLTGTLLGAFTGWVVGLFFTEAILSFLHRAGVNTIGLELWQVGAALGFMGAFFRGVTHTRTAKSA